MTDNKPKDVSPVDSFVDKAADNISILSLAGMIACVIMIIHIIIMHSIFSWVFAVGFALFIIAYFIARSLSNRKFEEGALPLAKRVTRLEQMVGEAVT